MLGLADLVLCHKIATIAQNVFSVTNRQCFKNIKNINDNLSES